MGVLDAMPSTNLKPDEEGVELEKDRVYRTTYMFSATMPPAVERLAKKYMRRPVVVTIGSAGRATDNVTQRVLVVKDNDKPGLLERVSSPPKTLWIRKGTSCTILDHVVPSFQVDGLTFAGYSWRPCPF
jgi:superfamily II DNA/RNA helicase